MAKKNGLKLFYDEFGDTLSIWFDEPKKEVICDELGNGIVAGKDKKGRIIGYEILCFSKLAKNKLLEVAAIK